MPDLSAARPKTGHGLLRPGVVAIGITLFVTIAMAYFAEIQNRAVYYQSARSKVGEQVGLVRAKLEGNINSNLQLLRGLVAVISANPDIDQVTFSRIAAGLIGNNSQLRNIAGAPGLVIRLMYPIEGNEQAIGLDYMKNDAQREAALRAVTSRQIMLAGPVDLLQGGQGFIGRFPVFLDRPDGTERLWGLVSAVVDVERLYAASGLLSPDLDIEIAIAGRDADSTDSTVFFGDSAVFENDPVLAEVSLPLGSWRIAAVPRGGWAQTPPNIWSLRLFLLFAGLLVVMPVSIAGFLYDQRRDHVRELKRSRDVMAKLSQRLRLALDTSKIGIWEYNIDTRELTWDRRMKELYGVPEKTETAQYDTWSNSLHTDDRDRAEEEFRVAVTTGNTYNSEFRAVTASGDTRWIRAMGAVHSKPDGQRYVVGVNWDVSEDIEIRRHLLSANEKAEIRNRELEDARAQVEHNSLHDSLTGLPNRRYLDEVLLNGHSGRALTALLHVDLDRFKQINDTLGHAAGDFMLIHAASILKQSTRDADFVARIGGDEFVIAITSPTDEQHLSALAGRIIERMRQPVAYDAHVCRFGVSIGIAIADREKDDFGKRLLIDADIALYRAKRDGRNRYEFYSVTLKAEIVRTKRVADDILSGLERQEFLPHYHLQFDARTLEIVGVEALARWRHPTQGILPPDVFMRTAEELNVVPLIDRTILEQALWQSTRWQAAGISIPKISVNVSAGRLHDKDLIATLDGLAIEPGKVSFELLESIFLDEENQTIAANFRRLRELGIDIEIDDFGTGYASILSLIHLRPKRLKIDRQLVTPITRSEGQRRLVASIVEIGQSLGVDVIAEGVETMEHAAILRDIGCHALQGYAFARPMSSDELIKFVREGRWRKVA